MACWRTYWLRQRAGWPACCGRLVQIADVLVSGAVTKSKPSKPEGLSPNLQRLIAKLVGLRPQLTAVSIGLAGGIAVATALGWAGSSIGILVVVAAGIVASVVAFVTKVVEKSPGETHARLAVGFLAALLLPIVVLWVASSTSSVVVEERDASEISRKSAGELLIVIQQAVRLEGVADSDIAGEIVRGIENNASAFGGMDVRVEVVSPESGLNEADRARDLAKRTKADAIVWARESAVRIEVGLILFTDLQLTFAKSPSSSVGLSGESIAETLTQTQAGGSTEYVDVVTDVVPSAVGQVVSVLAALNTENLDDRLELLEGALANGVEQFPSVGAVAHSLIALNSGGKSIEQRIEHAHRATELANEPFFWHVRLSIEFIAERLDLVVQSIELGEDRFAHDPVTYLDHGWALLARGYPMEADRSFTRGIEVGGDEYRFLRGRAQARLQLGQPESASADLEAVLSDSELQVPYDQVLLIRADLAMANLLSGKHELAKSQINQLLIDAFADLDQRRFLESAKSWNVPPEDLPLIHSQAEVLLLKARLLEATSGDEIEILRTVELAKKHLVGSKPGSVSTLSVGDVSHDIPNEHPYDIMRRAHMELFQWSVSKDRSFLTSATENLDWLDETGRAFYLPVGTLDQVRLLDACAVVPDSARRAFARHPYPELTMEPC